MLGRINLGQFVPGKTLIHRLNPAVKIIVTILSAAAIFTLPGFQGLLVSGVYVTILLISTGRLGLYAFRGLRPLLILITITFLFQAFTIPGETLFRLGPLDISKEGLEKAILFSGRLLLVVLLASILTLTTSPIALTHGLEKLLNPFKKYGVPAHELAMMMSIALRFIPTLINEAEVIMKAQRSRGADFTQGGPVSRVRALVPFIVPLLAGSLRRAEELAVAMDSRCYRGGINRTAMHQFVVQKKDYGALMVSMILLAISVAWRIVGW